MPSRSSRDRRFRIVDILDAIARCSSFTHGVAKEEFLRDEKTKAAVLYNLLTIGEAANHVPVEVLAEFPAAWDRIVGMRNRIVHGYFTVDAEVVWTAVQDNLPSLHEMVAAMRDAYPPTENS